MPPQELPPFHEDVSPTNNATLLRLNEYISELSEQGTPYFLGRYQLADPIVFNEVMDENDRWDIVDEQKNELFALTDDAEGSPKRIFWRDENGYPIETTILWIDEDFALAYEVRMDEKARPLDGEAVLWHGNEETMEDFLKDNPIKQDEAWDETMQHESEEIRRLKSLLETLPKGPRSRTVSLALLGLITTAAAAQAFVGLVRPGRMADDIYVADFYPRYIKAVPKKKRPDIKKLPANHVNNAHLPIVAKRHNHPIRRPKPYNGNKWGKRSQF